MEAALRAAKGAGRRGAIWLGILNYRGGPGPQPCFAKSTENSVLWATARTLGAIVGPLSGNGAIQGMAVVLGIPTVVEVMTTHYTLVYLE